MAKILVIDDNAELLDTMSLVLEGRGGHQAILSADGAEGLKKALADPPDLAIIDVMMPDISGYEICRQLRASSVTESVPIIILTARGQSVDRQAALEAGADDYIVKPVPMDELLERVGALLAKKEAERTAAPASTIALLSLRGGVGVTTLAVNLAATLAQTSGKEICLVDLCPSSGHVALQLGLRPDPNWTALTPPGAPDAEAVTAHLLRHNSGLRVLASPFSPLVEQELSRAMVQATLKTLQQRFAVIVVDAPPMLNEAMMATLEAATVVGMVITAEAPSIQAAVGTLRAFKQQPGKLQQVPIHIILNQVTPGGQLPAEAIERALKRPLMGPIPFDPNQARALAQGAPLALHNPTSPLAQAVQGISRQLSVVSC